MENSKRMVEILDRLGAEFKPWHWRGGTPFLILVGTVLSQNTNWHNTEIAFNRLTSRFRTPEQLAEADEGEIEELIRPAGLHRAKSRRLRELARIICARYGGDLMKVLRRPPQEAREELLSLPGVGYKTADCLLLFAAKRDVLPVDTHIAKVAKRLGLASPRDDREEIKAKLEGIIPAGRRGEAHISLIQHGRKYCDARKPLCDDCPIGGLCPRLEVR